MKTFMSSLRKLSWQKSHNYLVCEFTAHHTSVSYLFVLMKMLFSALLLSTCLISLCLIIVVRSGLMFRCHEQYRLLFDLTKTGSWQPFFTKSYPRPSMLSNQVQFHHFVYLLTKGLVTWRWR